MSDMPDEMATPPKTTVAILAATAVGAGVAEHYGLELSTLAQLGIGSVMAVAGGGVGAHIALRSENKDLDYAVEHWVEGSVMGSGMYAVNGCLEAAVKGAQGFVAGWFATPFAAWALKELTEVVMPYVDQIVQYTQ